VESPLVCLRIPVTWGAFVVALVIHGVVVPFMAVSRPGR
jgi:hypothetical protein